MQLSASLNLRQKQSLVMTPQLQQAIRLLQMTNLDLRQYLETECSENPFLEVDTDEDGKSTSKSPEIEKDKSSNEDNSSSELDSVIADGTALTDDPTANTDFENRFENDLTDFRTKTNSTTQSDDYDFISSSVENNPISLQEHVY